MPAPLSFNSPAGPIAKTEAFFPNRFAKRSHNSYVPNRYWGIAEGVGILPYLFEYGLMVQKDGRPLEEFHEENVRRIDLAGHWSTAIMLYPRQPEYRRARRHEDFVATSQATGKPCGKRSSPPGTLERCSTIGLAN